MGWMLTLPTVGQSFGSVLLPSDSEGLASTLPSNGWLILDDFTIGGASSHLCGSHANP
jgi:hypothetical protein